MESPDLTQRPPRSPRIRLGGYVLLPRMLDKCRAELAGKNGDYHYNCPLDQRFLSFVGLGAETIREQVAKGLSDGEILAWIEVNAPNQREPWEVTQWSVFREAAAPGDNESRSFFNDQLAKAGAGAREDIVTWFDYLDVDDHVSFGGKA